MRWQKASVHAWLGRVALAPGQYTTYTRKGDCRSGTFVTLLPGVPRSIVAVSSADIIPIVDATLSLAGTLPIAGVSVELRYSATDIEYATTDGIGYYFDGVRPCRCTLRLKLPAGLMADFIVDVPSHPAMPIERKDISAEQLYGAVGTVAANNEIRKLFNP